MHQKCSSVRDICSDSIHGASAFQIFQSKAVLPNQMPFTGFCLMAQMIISRRIGSLAFWHLGLVWCQQIVCALIHAKVKANSERGCVCLEDCVQNKKQQDVKFTVSRLCVTAEILASSVSFCRTLLPAIFNKSLCTKTTFVPVFLCI